MTGFYVFITNVLIGNGYMFVCGLVNKFLLLTFRGSVSTITGGIFVDVVLPTIKQILYSGFTFIKHVSVTTVHIRLLPLY